MPKKMLTLNLARGNKLTVAFEMVRRKPVLTIVSSLPVILKAPAPPPPPSKQYLARKAKGNQARPSKP